MAVVVRSVAHQSQLLGYPYTARDSPDVVLAGSTMGSSSVSIEAMTVGNKTRVPRALARAPRLFQYRRATRRTERVSSPSTTMSGFDADRIFTANAPTEARTRVENAPAAVEGDLLDFILEFRVGGQFKYRCVVECTAARSP